MPDLDDAVQRDKKRAPIEPFFSDQKSRGFPMRESRLSDPTRLGRVLIALCPAYLWIVHLGVCAAGKDWMPQLHRQDRCDLRLFRLGLRLPARRLKDYPPIPDGFLVPSVLPTALIRTFQEQVASYMFSVR